MPPLEGLSFDSHIIRRIAATWKTGNLFPSLKPLPFFETSLCVLLPDKASLYTIRFPLQVCCSVLVYCKGTGMSLLWLLGWVLLLVTASILLYNFCLFSLHSSSSLDLFFSFFYLLLNTVEDVRASSFPVRSAETVW